MTTPTPHDGTAPIEDPVPHEDEIRPTDAPHEGDAPAADVHPEAPGSIDADAVRVDAPEPASEADPLAGTGAIPVDRAVEPSLERTATLPVPPPPPPGAAGPLITTAPPATSPADAPGTGGVPAPGQHAAPRPYPPVAPVASRAMATDAEGLLPGATPTVAPAAPVADDPAPTAAMPAVDPAPPTGPAPPFAAAPGAPLAAPVANRPVVPDLPRRPGAKRHLLGILVGLLLTPVGLVLAAMGIGHMVDLPAGNGALTDVFGLVQLGAGALVLTVVALLGRWSPAVPTTGGLLWGVGAGGLALGDPQGVSEAVHGVTDGRFAQVAIDHILFPAQTGSLLVLGLVLLGAGIATGAARRAGRTFGTRTVHAETARAEAQRVDGEHRSGTHQAEAHQAEAVRSIP